MGQKIVTSAENLALLDLIIANKKAPVRDTRLVADDIVIITPNYYIIHEGGPVGGGPQTEARILYFDKVSNKASDALPEPSVDELVQLRNSIEVK
jgi:hypothetical protein